MREQEKQIEEMCKDYKLCYPCEMFGGYIDEDGVTLLECRCVQGLDCTKCGITKKFAKVLINQGYRKVSEDSVKFSKKRGE